MPHCINSKKQKQSIRKSKNGKNHRKSKVQHGGVSNACVLDTAMHGGITHCGAGTNLHNVNPQAALDLDNKFMAYGGPVPLGANILQGGANRCGDDGVGTNNGKTETFKQYLNGLDKQLGNVMKGGANQPMDMEEEMSMGNEEMPEPIPDTPMPMQNNTSMANTYMANTPMDMQNNANTPMPMQKNETMNEDPINPTLNGGGFSTDPSEFIAGLPVYKAYDDCCPPAIVGGQLKFGAPDQPVCGLGAIKGGARKNSKKSKKGKKANKSKKTKKSKGRKTQRGGDWNAVGRSKPAMYSDAFNGPASVFAYPDDMMKRAFDETQPNYTPNAI